MAGSPTERGPETAFQPLRASSRVIHERGRFKLIAMALGLNSC